MTGVSVAASQNGFCLMFHCKSTLSRFLEVQYLMLKVGVIVREHINYGLYILEFCGALFPIRNNYILFSSKVISFIDALFFIFADFFVDNPACICEHFVASGFNLAAS